MAHELGHGWGMAHIQSPPDHTNDGPWEDFPHAHGAMGPQRGIRIGPGGVSVVVPVSGTDHMHDIMTYGFPNWISPYTYCKLMNWISNGTLTCPAAATRADARREEIHLAKFPASSLFAQTKSSLPKEGTSLSIAGQVNRDGSANLAPFEMTNAPANQSTGKGYSVTLESSTGEVIVERTFDLRSHDARPGEPSPFSLIVQWDERTGRIVLRRGGKILATRIVSASDPQVAMVEQKEGAVLSGQQTISWSGTDPDGDDLTYSVHYSIDGGNRWVPLGVFLETTSYDVNFDAVAGSDTAMLRVLASDGVRTAEARSAMFNVPRKAPQLTVQPADGSTVSLDNDLVLEARAFDWEDGSITNPASYRWASDRDGELGSGTWLIPRNAHLSPGVHTITVTATDLDQEAARATFLVTVPAISLTHVKSQ